LKSYNPNKNSGDYKDTIALVSVKYFNNEWSLKALNSMGFKAVLFFVPHSMANQLKKVRFQLDPSKLSTNSGYVDNSFDSLKREKPNHSIYLKSSIPLSSPCFFTFSDIRAIR